MVRKFVVHLSLLWGILLVLAFINITFRELVLRKFWSEIVAKQVIVLPILVCFFVAIYFYCKFFLANESRRFYLGLGFGLMVLTVLFEFGFGMFVVKKSFTELLVEYNLFEGNLWVLILVGILFIPELVFYLFLKKE